MSRIRTSDLRRELENGPATAAELAAVLGMTQRDAQVGLYVLRLTGQAQIAGYIPHPEPGRGKSTLALHELTPHGRYMLKRAG